MIELLWVPLLLPVAVMVVSMLLSRLERFATRTRTAARSDGAGPRRPPLLAEERAATSSGPALAAHDGSAAAERALAVAAGSPDGHEQGADTDVDARGVPADALRLRADGFGPSAVTAALAREAAAQRAGVIVIGSRRRSLLREVVLGSNARAVLHHGHRPVLVVPPRPCGVR